MSHGNNDDHKTDNNENDHASHQSAVQSITKALQKAGIPSKKAWWERYLKHEIEFYGVPMADIRRIVKAWVVDNQETKRNDDTNTNSKPDLSLLLLPVAWRLFRQPIAEQKLAAISILQEHAFDQLDATRDLPILAQLLDQGFIADWNTTDWLCVRVLGKWMMTTTTNQDNDKDNPTVALQIAAWAKDPNASLWRQRAALVAFWQPYRRTAVRRVDSRHGHGLAPRSPRGATILSNGHWLGAARTESIVSVSRRFIRPTTPW